MSQNFTQYTLNYAQLKINLIKVLDMLETITYLRRLEEKGQVCLILLSKMAANFIYLFSN